MATLKTQQSLNSSCLLAATASANAPDLSHISHTEYHGFRSTACQTGPELPPVGPGFQGCISHLQIEGENSIAVLWFQNTQRNFSLDMFLSILSEAKIVIQKAFTPKRSQADCKILIERGVIDCVNACHRFSLDEETLHILSRHAVMQAMQEHIQITAEGLPDIGSED